MLYDKIRLIEPLTCYSCGSTSETEVGTNKEEIKARIGKGTLKIISIHNGKGGIKVFQTLDLSGLFETYQFPGIIEREDLDPEVLRRPSNPSPSILPRDVMYVVLFGMEHSISDMKKKMISS